MEGKNGGSGVGAELGLWVKLTAVPLGNRIQTGAVARGHACAAGERVGRHPWFSLLVAFSLAPGSGIGKELRWDSRLSG